MKRPYILAGLAVAAAAAAALWQPAKPVDLPKLLPPGALLVLEAKDLRRLVDDWNGSDRKKGWLGSDNYAIFSRSRLFQRLGDLQGEYAQVAGFAPDLPLLQLCAGSQTALALYDIPKAEFLYLTRTSAADTVQKLLAQSSTKYEPREMAGQRYWLRTVPQTGKTAAFAAYDDILLLATREDLIASALAALKGEARASASEEAWYAKPVKAAGPAGELRLVMNLAKLVEAPHFRSYWIQRNVSELRPFLSAISDLDRQADRVDERRVLVRSEAASVTADHDAAGRMLALVPDDAGFYRASSAPASEELIGRLSRKLIDPGPGSAEPTRFAPSAGSPDSTVGTADALETRIDEPPLKLNARVNLQPLRDLLAANRLAAELEVGSTAPLPGGVFLEPRQAVAILGHQPWPEAAARAAFPPEIAVRTKGNLLVAGRDAHQVQVMVEHPAPAKPQNINYAAGFRYSREFDRFVNLFQFLEQGNGTDTYQAQPGGPAAPRFFSGNLASLGRTLLRMDSATLTARELGDRIEEQVQYRLAP